MTSNYLNNITERDQKRNKSVQPRPSAVNMTLPAFAAERQRLLWIDIFCPGAQQQTRRTPLLLSIDGTDGQMLGRFIDLAAHAMRAVLVAYTPGGCLKSVLSVPISAGYVFMWTHMAFNRKKHIGYINVICVS